MALTFNKVLRFVERFAFCSLIAIAIPLNAQQAATTTWTGVVRTTAGQAVPGAKVTVSTMGRKQTAITGSDGKFSIESVAQEPHTVTVQLTGHSPTTPLAVNISSASVALTVSDQNVLSIAANPQTPAAGVSNGDASTTSNAASGTGGEKLSSQ